MDTNIVVSVVWKLVIILVEDLSNYRMIQIRFMSFFQLKLITLKS